MPQSDNDKKMHIVCLGKNLRRELGNCPGLLYGMNFARNQRKNIANIPAPTNVLLRDLQE